MYFGVPIGADYVVEDERCWCCDEARLVTDIGLCATCRDALASAPRPAQ